MLGRGGAEISGDSSTAIELERMDTLVKSVLKAGWTACCRRIAAGNADIDVMRGMLRADGLTRRCTVP